MALDFVSPSWCTRHNVHEHFLHTLPYSENCTISLNTSIWHSTLRWPQKTLNILQSHVDCLQGAFLVIIVFVLFAVQNIQPFYCGIECKVKFTEYHFLWKEKIGQCNFGISKRGTWDCLVQNISIYGICICAFARCFCLKWLALHWRSTFWEENHLIEKVGLMCF